MNKYLLLVALSAISLQSSAEDIDLPQPLITGGKPLKEALNQRKTTREFSNEKPDDQTLSDLLWCAYGFNRDDKRVVPSSQNRQEIDLYVVLETGVYLYDAKANKLIEKVKGDHRKSVGKQDFVYTAPVNFIMVGDLNKASNKEACYIDSGAIVQNIYLFCASEGLGSVVRGYFDKDEVKKLLDLDDMQEITITQTVGYPE